MADPIVIPYFSDDDDDDDDDVERTTSPSASSSSFTSYHLRNNPDSERAQQQYGVICPHFIVLTFQTDCDTTTHPPPVTRGTQICHQLLFQQLHDASPTNGRCWETLWHALQDALRDEFPFIRQRDLVVLLVECTPTVLQAKLVDEANTHAALARDDGGHAARYYYGLCTQPVPALQLYYRTVFPLWIPTSVTERLTWVASVEDAFCTWQQQHQNTGRLQLSQQPHRPEAGFSEKVENLRLAIQFVQEHLQQPEAAGNNRRQGEAAGHMEHLIVGHLRLIRNGWHELQTLSASNRFSEEQQPSVAKHASALTKPVRSTSSWTKLVRDMPCPLESLQSLPTTRKERLVYLTRMRQNYLVWKRTCYVATHFRPNVLLAFETLQRHAAEWLTYRQDMAESTLQLFFQLLLDRWTEFMTKTRQYTNDPDTSVKRARKDEDNDGSNAASTKKARLDDTASMSTADTVMDGSVLLDSVINVEATSPPVPSTISVPESMVMSTTNQKTTSWDCHNDDDDDDDDCSQMTTPMDDTTLDESNPLRADAIKRLYRAVANNANDNVSVVQRWLNQGAVLTPNGALDIFGETVYHQAAATGQVRTLKRLRLWGANPWDRCTRSGALALHMACFNGRVAACQVLLQHLVCSNGSLSVCQWAKLVDHRGRTPLHYACWGGQEGVVHWLCSVTTPTTTDAHADASPLTPFALQRDDEDLLPWHYAKFGRHEHLAHYMEMLGGGEINSRKEEDGKFDPANYVRNDRAKGRLGMWQWILESNYFDLYEDGDNAVVVCNSGQVAVSDAPQSDLERLTLSHHAVVGDA